MDSFSGSKDREEDVSLWRSPVTVCLRQSPDQNHFFSAPACTRIQFQSTKRYTWTLSTAKPLFKIIVDALYRVLISSQPDQEGNKLGSMSGTCAISTTSRRELSSNIFLQGKAPKEIHAILTETLACFLPGRAKDLSAPRYRFLGVYAKF